MNRMCAFLKSAMSTAGPWRCSIATISRGTTRTAAPGCRNSSVSRRLLGTLPVIYNVANLPKPAPGEAALISFDDVITMFHEFGHALHGMFSDTRYPTLSGTSTARDFVEFPSQFNEYWATYPSRVQALSPSIIKQARRCRMPWSRRSRKQGISPKATRSPNCWRLPNSTCNGMYSPRMRLCKIPMHSKSRRCAKTHLDLPAVPPRYRSSYFSHIWASGYSAGYYAYLWTQMLAADGYQWFDDHGGLSRANGDRFRRMVLSRGNTEDLSALYLAWRGKAPSIDAMMKYRDLVPLR